MVPGRRYALKLIVAEDWARLFPIMYDKERDLLRPDSVPSALQIALNVGGSARYVLQWSGRGELRTASYDNLSFRIEYSRYVLPPRSTAFSTVIPIFSATRREALFSGFIQPETFSNP